MKNRIFGIVFVVITICYAGVIFFLSSQNGAETAALSRGVSYNIAKLIYGESEPTDIQINNVHRILRKSAHIVLFLVLGILVTISMVTILVKSPWLAYVSSFIIVSSCAFFDEWHKLFIDGRHFDIGESILNGVCGLAGVIIVAVIYFFLRKKA